jgi:ABC-type lipoprotein export system ATPase subunit
MAEDASHKDPLILAQGLTRIYGLGSAEVVGVQDIDLAITSGELVLLKGDSGSGKSTLLGLLAGLDQPTRGYLKVAGRDLAQATSRQLDRYRRDRVGMVFQTFNLLPTLTVIENVCLPALLAGRPYPDVKNQALEQLDWLNLTPRMGHYPAQLSGGEMQRTAIARALINRPPIILADEPTGNLDTRNGQIVIQLLTDLNRRLRSTVIVATHSAIADAVANRHVRLKDGKIIETVTCRP